MYILLISYIKNIVYSYLLTNKIAKLHIFYYILYNT